jgi:hypothetical protein
MIRKSAGMIAETPFFVGEDGFLMGDGASNR